MVLLVAPTVAAAQECQSRNAGSADARARQLSAIAYVEAVNAAEARSQKQDGRYAPLDKLSGVPSVPVGFVAKLLLDQWSYVLSLKDFFDPCGRALFSDERGIVYEAYPHSPANQTSDGSTKVPSQGEGSGTDHH
jgi:hypothetical protein